VHFSVQSNHVHLIAEAADRRSLSRGMQGISIRVARAVNRGLGRTGRVLADRHHARALRTPRAAYFAVRYVLLNVRKHLRGPQGSAEASSAGLSPGFMDECSSAPWFSGFRRPAELAFGAREAREDWQRASGSIEPPVVRGESWLLRSGWRRAGDFDVDELPG